MILMPSNFNFGTEDMRRQFEKIVAHAESLGKEREQSLQRCVERLSALAANCNERVQIYPDFAPYSFCWKAAGMFGGCIFHGSHDNGGDGGAPTFSVNINPQDGWSLHT